MIEFLPAAVSVAMTLSTVWILARGARRRVSAETAWALDALVPTDEQLQREREAYILLRTTWKPAPGSPLDWSLGLLQDECQKKIEARKRPPAPKGTSATSRGREPTPPPPRGGSGQATARDVPWWLHEVSRLRAEVGQLSDQEAIRQLHADTGQLRERERYLRDVTKQLRQQAEQPPPTTGQWEPPDWLRTEDVT